MNTFNVMIIVVAIVAARPLRLAQVSVRGVQIA